MYLEETVSKNIHFGDISSSMNGGKFEIQILQNDQMRCFVCLYNVDICAIATFRFFFKFPHNLLQFIIDNE